MLLAIIIQGQCIKKGGVVSQLVRRGDVKVEAFPCTSIQVYLFHLQSFLGNRLRLVFHLLVLCLP